MKTKNTTRIAGADFNTTGLIVAFVVLIVFLYSFTYQAVANTPELMYHLSK